jgi:glycine hydroxymethyltransferase
MSSLSKVDREVYDAINSEERRQHSNLELIASENYVSQAVLEAQGSVLTNKYAEGYPGRRWYGGCEHIDTAETLAIERAKKLFGAEHVNVQPHSGTQANMAVCFTILKHGDTIAAMDIAAGGHLSHGHPLNFTGKLYNVKSYGVRKGDERIDVEEIKNIVRRYRPKMLIVGASAYPRIIDFEKIVREVKSIDDKIVVTADIAHIAGPVATGLHPNPAPYCEFVTTTTHKTLRGPRGGIVMCKKGYAKDLDTVVFPGIQGGPLEHVIAAKAVCFYEALQPAFRDYQEQIIKNAKTLAQSLQDLGYRIVSGGTDNHLLLVDVYSTLGKSGKWAEDSLSRVNITINKNVIPYDKLPPVQASGIRLGTPALTTRGMKEKQMETIAELMDRVLRARDKRELCDVRKSVSRLAEEFPIPKRFK